MEIFDRTFRITSVLRMVSGLVAFIGVLSALMALQLERARELGVLRANGLTPGQVWHLVTSQTGLMGLAAGSSSYFIFVAAVFFVYWLSPQRRLLRLAIILLANYYFCARYGLFYLALIPVASTIDFLVGLGLMRLRDTLARRLLIFISVAMNLALLVGSRHMGALINAPALQRLTNDQTSRHAARDAAT